jgi:hypothetical protein
VGALRAVEASTKGPRHVTIPLSHDYAQQSLLSPEALKGSDWALYRVVSRAWESELLTVVARDVWTATDDEDLDEYGHHYGEGASVFSCYAFSKVGKNV